MQAEDQSHYTVKVVFRGLFLAVVHDSEQQEGTPPTGFVEVLLPDASTPAHTIAKSGEEIRPLLESLQPLREHYGILEFPISQWENPSSVTPGVIQVTKPTKEPVGMFFLKRHNIKFRDLWGQEENPPGDLVEDAHHYSKVGERLLVLRKHDVHGFNQLPGFDSDPTPHSPKRDKVITARATLEFGEIFTERRSKFKGVERKWEQLKPGQVKKEPAPNLENARPINLDLVLRFDLPITNPLLIVCEPLDPGLAVRQFILRPARPGQGVTVWVKNRELEATLLESDLLDDPFGISCPDFSDGVDRDHAFYMLLAANPENVTLPRDVSDDAADCGSGCGGCGHPKGP
jgi:hypothetical protein